MKREINGKEEFFGLNNFERFLFFNCEEKGFLGKVDGCYNSVFSNENILISQNLDTDSILLAQLKNFSLEILDKNYSNIYITYIPAKELSYLNINNNDIILANDKFLKIFEKPLLKILNESEFNQLKSVNKEASENQFIKCEISGRRSAIIFHENYAIRLKGCGNNFNGFELGQVLSLGENHYEIFGCQFKNTCLREQYISNEINKRLQDLNFTCGNLPLGFWKYDAEFLESMKMENQKNNISNKALNNDAKLIDKYCGLFLTLGEKRLGHHFFKGFHYILEKLLTNKPFLKRIIEIIDINIFNKCFNQKNDSSDIFNYKNFYEMKYIVPECLFEINYPENDYNNLFDVLNVVLKNKDEIEITNDIKNEIFIFDFIHHLINEKIKSNNLYNDILKEFIILKNKIIKAIQEKHLNLFSCLLLLFSQISYELGLIKKCMEKNDFNWGTYEYHCNAHLDNLLVIKYNKNKRLLSPIDFDLAYFRNEFIDLKYRNLKGIEDNLNFDELILREKNYLLIQLLGINPIPNIDVDLRYFRNIIDSLNKNDDPESQNFKKYLENLENLLKENISLYYSKGFNECKTAISLFEEFYELNYMIMEFVLLTENLL